ncbi:MAG: transglycosylase SLT domain-containing protein [Anaerolineaceae bacterium]|nr:MAG: transglycosylase SLT domain-containing protein [Anaerolineaceae bacterium]
MDLGGRPTATSTDFPLRTAAISSPVRWIPTLLTFLLILASVRSWGALRSGLVNLAHQSLYQADTSIANFEYEFGLGLPGVSYEAGGISPVFTPQVRTWSAEISQWAVEFELDPNLIALVMQIESCGHPKVHSPVGAMGLFQVMPFHFKEGEDPLNPQTNAVRGLSYLARSLDLSNGRVDLALAGYNGGHGVIDREPNTWAPETRRYVQWGMGILEDIFKGERKSAKLDAWLAAGGANLCRRASAELEG